MFDKKGAHYGLQVFTRSRNYFTLYKSAGAFDKKGTDAAGRWRASGRITVGTCRSRHSDRDIISAVCSGDWCDRSDVLCRYGDRYQRTESMRKGILYHCTLWSTGTACGWICYGIFLQSAGATSVSITVETLKELGKLKTRSGNAILGAAIIDDILGIVALTIVTSISDPSVKIGMVMLKIVGFFVFAAVVGFIFYKLYKNWVDKANKEKHRHTIVAFVFCLLMAYIAEDIFGVADITGAFIAGLIISNVQRSTYLETKFDTLSYLLLSPVFFASIGLKVELPKMSAAIVGFAVALTIVAVLTKVVGCGFGAKICHYKNYQAKRIGIGMISRGEVALIVASKGAALGLLGSAFLGPIIIVVVITTIITPVFLKVVFAPGTAPVPEQIVPESERVKTIYESKKRE